MKATRIVVEFEDGSSTEIPAEGVGSLFLDAAGAKKAGRKVKDEAVTTQGDNCYLVNGIIVCP